MIERDHVFSFFDDTHSRIVSDILQWNRSFSFSASTSFTTSATYTHSYASFFPASYTANASGTYILSTPASNSNYYWHTLMLLYKTGALPTFNGVFTLTGGMSSSMVSTSANNIGFPNPTLINDQYTSTSFTAGYLYVFTVGKKVFGDHIKVGNLSAFMGSTLFMHDDGNTHRNFQRLVIDHPTYSASTLAWVLYDFGKIILYDPTNALSASLSGVSRFDFDNAVYIANTTMHITLESTEFNYSQNQSFYDKYYYTGRVVSPHITAIGFYNEKDELLAVAKIATPIKKFDKLPVTFKVSLDMI